MPGLSSLGPLKVTAWRSGSRVPVATELAIGEIRIPAPAEPFIVLVPSTISSLQQMWDALRMPSRNNLLVTGESGSGKTMLVRYLGEVYRQALLVMAAGLHDPHAAAHAAERAASFQTRILTFHENLRRSDITERRHYGETGEEKTGWTMSDVMDGMVAGDWNVLSEINRTGEDVQAEFNEPLENKAKSLHQRVIRGHPDSRFIATVNPQKSEGRGIYEGKVMSGEFVNRFTNKVHLRFLPPDEEFEVLKDYGPGVDDSILDRLIAVANDIRRDYTEEHGVVPFPVTTRGLIRVVRHLARFPEDCCLLRSLFWRKAYWLDDRIHPPIARKLVLDLLDLHDIVDAGDRRREHSRVVREEGGNAPLLRIGSVAYPLGQGGPYVPDTEIEEVPQNLADLEWILKDIALGENILLIGEAGVGKNKIESYLAHLLNYNLLVIGMSGETRVSDLLTYRSFGEDEAGKTGDTATLGLRALTDPDHGWIIVLDEANKAQPGVLVSFNDLLQDRSVRLPGGREVPVRASICVNINPNRPPYEVNDFSFEFMDRFSIHTIVHLPPGQAVEVLKRKYPGADPDFVSDVVQGYYTLHPLYSSGMLFEPVTMRNEEAAIERGLQYASRAVNLVDLLCSCYGPRDGRELHAVQAALSAAGYDRNVLAASAALERFRTSWDQKKGDEEKGIALAETYQAIGKPLAAIRVLREMIPHIPAGRDWVCHLRIAEILLACGRDANACDEIKAGFSPGGLLLMDHGDEYRVLEMEVRVTQGRHAFSAEAVNHRTGYPALITNLPSSPAPSLHRSGGEYVLVASDQMHTLAIYEMAQPETKIPASPSLAMIVREMVQACGSCQEFVRTLYRLPSPPWTSPSYREGEVSREHPAGFRLVATPDGWAIHIPGEGMVRWKGGICAWSGREGGAQVPCAGDPFRGLAYHEGTLFLILEDTCAAAVGIRGAGFRSMATGSYQSAILAPLIRTAYPRLEDLFVYARPRSTVRLGFGDILYTLIPGKGIQIGFVVEVDGFGPVIWDLSPSEGDQHPLSEQLVIPFSLLDVCEERRRQVLLPETQEHLQALRRYAASVFLSTVKPRDMIAESKMSMILAEFRECAEPIRRGTQLSRGDILVCDSNGRDHLRSVFIVRFLQEGGSSGGLKGTPPIVRGFWLGQPNPVATLELASLPGRFGRLKVIEDDRYDRILSHLVASFQESGHPWQYARTGPAHDPLVHLEISNISLEYRPMERLFSFAVGRKGDGTGLVINQAGYPAGTTVLHAGDGREVRWQGLPISDIRYYKEQDTLVVSLENDFLSAMNGILRESGVGSSGMEVRFIPWSPAGEKI